MAMIYEVDNKHCMLGKKAVALLTVGSLVKFTKCYWDWNSLSSLVALSQNTFQISVGKVPSSPLLLTTEAVNCAHNWSWYNWEHKRCTLSAPIAFTIIIRWFFSTILPYWANISDNSHWLVPNADKKYPNGCSNWCKSLVRELFCLLVQHSSYLTLLIFPRGACHSSPWQFWRGEGQSMQPCWSSCVKCAQEWWASRFNCRGINLHW